MQQFINANPGVLLILCRHGATEANDGKAPSVRGWQDLPLGDDGKIEAQLTGNNLKKYGIKGITCSDFMRDTETAQIISKIIGVPNIDVDFNARTWDVGIYSGDKLKDANPAIEALYKMPWKTPPGSGESFNDFSARFTKLLTNKMTLASIDVFRPQLIVTHGKNIALANTYINGGLEWESIMPKPAGVAVISVEPNRSLAMKIFPPTEPVIEDI